jgi:hypothetical protein
VWAGTVALVEMHGRGVVRRAMARSFEGSVMSLALLLLGATSSLLGDQPQSPLVEQLWTRVNVSLAWTMTDVLDSRGATTTTPTSFSNRALNETLCPIPNGCDLLFGWPLDTLRGAVSTGPELLSSSVIHMGQIGFGVSPFGGASWTPISQALRSETQGMVISAWYRTPPARVSSFDYFGIGDLSGMAGYGVTQLSVFSSRVGIADNGPLSVRASSRFSATVNGPLFPPPIAPRIWNGLLSTGQLLGETLGQTFYSNQWVHVVMVVSAARNGSKVVWMNGNLLPLGCALEHGLQLAQGAIDDEVALPERFRQGCLVDSASYPNTTVANLTRMPTSLNASLVLGTNSWFSQPGYPYMADAGGATSSLSLHLTRVPLTVGAYLAAAEGDATVATSLMPLIEGGGVTCRRTAPEMRLGQRVMCVAHCSDPSLVVSWNISQACAVRDASTLIDWNTLCGMRGSVDGALVGVGHDAWAIAPATTATPFGWSGVLGLFVSGPSRTSTITPDEWALATPWQSDSVSLRHRAPLQCLSQTNTLQQLRAEGHSLLLTACLGGLALDASTRDTASLLSDVQLLEKLGIEMRTAILLLSGVDNATLSAVGMEVEFTDNATLLEVFPQLTGRDLCAHPVASRLVSPVSCLCAVAVASTDTPGAPAPSLLFANAAASLRVAPAITAQPNILTSVSPESVSVVHTTFCPSWNAPPFPTLGSAAGSFLETVLTAVHTGDTSQRSVVASLTACPDAPSFSIIANLLPLVTWAIVAGVVSVAYRARHGSLFSHRQSDGASLIDEACPTKIPPRWYRMLVLVVYPCLASLTLGERDAAHPQIDEHPPLESLARASPQTRTTRADSPASRVEVFRSPIVKISAHAESHDDSDDSAQEERVPSRAMSDADAPASLTLPHVAFRDAAVASLSVAAFVQQCVSLVSLSVLPWVTPLQLVTFAMWVFLPVTLRVFVLMSGACECFDGGALGTAGDVTRTPPRVWGPSFSDRSLRSPASMVGVLAWATLDLRGLRMLVSGIAPACTVRPLLPKTVIRRELALLESGMLVFLVGCVAHCCMLGAQLNAHACEMMDLAVLMSACDTTCSGLSCLVMGSGWTTIGWPLLGCAAFCFAAAVSRMRDLLNVCLCSRGWE